MASQQNNIIQCMENFLLINWDKITTLMFAFLATVFAGITVWLTFLSYTRDNPKIIVKVSRGFLTLTNDRLIDCVVCRITNHGRRSITVNQIFLSLKNNETMIFLPDNEILIDSGKQLPLDLSESSSADFYLLLNNLAVTLKEKHKRIQAVCFRDDTGKIYKYKIKKKYWGELF